MQPFGYTSASVTPGGPAPGTSLARNGSIVLGLVMAALERSLEEATSR